VSWEYVDTKKTTSIVRISPTSVPVPLLMKASKHLDPKLIEKPLPLTPNFDDSLWKVVISTKKANISLVKIKLSLYNQILVNDNDVKSPLQWWNDHEKKFLLLHFLFNNFWVF
jgi:hypothetical protein